MELMSKLTQKIARSPGDPEVIQSGPGSKQFPDHVARALGWFSIGLGLAELIAPGMIARALGMEDRKGLLRAYGARELAAGRLALSVDKTAGMWSRVGGDVMDLATLAYANNSENPKKKNVGAALALVAGITLIDLMTAQTLTVQKARGAKGPPRSYADRSGFPGGVAAARGAAADFRKPDDMSAQMTPAVIPPAGQTATVTPIRDGGSQRPH